MRHWNLHTPPPKRAMHSALQAGVDPLPLPLAQAQQDAGSHTRTRAHACMHAPHTLCHMHLHQRKCTPPQTGFLCVGVLEPRHVFLAVVMLAHPPEPSTPRWLIQKGLLLCTNTTQTRAGRPSAPPRQNAEAASPTLTPPLRQRRPPHSTAPANLRSYAHGAAGARARRIGPLITSRTHCPRARSSPCPWTRQWSHGSWP